MSNGKTLNDFMFRGPNLQQDLQTLILKWRQFRYAFTADIEKMFRQIWVHRDDQRFQKIIWRNSPNEALQEYQLATVTYGTKSAPFLAMITLKQLAQDEQDCYNNKVIQTIQNSFYMDDLLQDYNPEIYGWTDSQVVLAWIQGDEARWRTFVSNRVRQIKEVIPGGSWRYVKSSENPADCASRGILPSQLKKQRQREKSPRMPHRRKYTKIAS
ncbi:uncharacterized protein LOC142985870 [Anticarsia gemmatalis]|uniref:uncharacterized protein LOC142985870 n=1 Tax=Anticarsia gemmatalis TaxID=129554 RepID=UPI003F75758E